MEETKFYVVEITKYNDGRADAYAVYAKDSENEALKTFHQKMAAALGSSVVLFELCQVINDYGVVFKNEYYIASTEEQPVEG